MVESFKRLQKIFEGEVEYSNTFRQIYSTDASAYKEKPMAVCFPKNDRDIVRLINFAKQNKTSITFRGAGTSLAGQVTTAGIVADVSKHMNSIRRLDTKKKQVVVQPGIVLSDLNLFLKPFGLFFGPETSTANRCTLGGMLGNNACGLHSLVYGSTRDKIIRVKTILSDGSIVFFESLSKNKFLEKTKGETLENKIYKQISTILSKPENQTEIHSQYPRKDLHRRNTGYALDCLLETSTFTSAKKDINLAKFIAGSEGTLAFSSEITLQLSPLPPKEKALVTVHFKHLSEAFLANLIALKYSPSAVELADSTILNLTKENNDLQKNRFFIKGEPAAILIIEFNADTFEEINKRIKKMIAELKAESLGYHYPVISKENITKVWHLRRAGLGVLSNLPGDAKPVSLVEDTAVHPEDLPNYIKEFDKIMETHHLQCVYHAHIGSGELHLRPILNLKKNKDREIFRKVGYETAKLVKKYNGSLSGEHGDGRLRGEFIRIIYGEKIYRFFEEIKAIWDKNNIFNPGKITATPPMNTSLRYKINAEDKKFTTIFDFSHTKGLLRATEKCNGSADCRKSAKMGGTLCPSYMGTFEEKNTTRARANLYREVLTTDKNPFDNKELFAILDLCLSCKACKTECPSGVDMTKLKAEFLNKYYEKNKIPIRNKIIAQNAEFIKYLAIFPRISNFLMKTRFSKAILAKIGFHKKRNLPEISIKSFLKIYRKELKINHSNKHSIYLFADEFTKYNETEIGKYTLLLLQKLGYNIIIPEHIESGRASLSKGMLKKARGIAKINIDLLGQKISSQSPLVGIEPSAILCFRDEYQDFYYPNKSKDLKEKLDNLKKNTFTLDEFLMREMKNGNIKKEQFTLKSQEILLHGHCQQKALSSTDALLYVLNFPENYNVSEIPSGCCGMAGSFGYEKEHYDLSIKIGALILFPAVAAAKESTIICASGTSCRHQIKDGTKRKAIHPAEIMYKALLEK